MCRTFQVIFIIHEINLQNKYLLDFLKISIAHFLPESIRRTGCDTPGELISFLLGSRIFHNTHDQTVRQAGNRPILFPDLFWQISLSVFLVFLYVI